MNLLYCLWFGKQKIHDLEQLKKNFDFDAAEMYLLGGGLSRWLRQCGEYETAAHVENIDLHGDISKQLSEIFAVKLPKNRSNSLYPALSREVNAIPVKKIAVFFPSLDDISAGFDNTNVNLKPGSFDMEPGLSSFDLPAENKTGYFKLNTDSFELSAGSFELNSGSFEISAGSFGYGSFETVSGLFGASFFSSSFSLLTGSFELSSYNSIFSFNSGTGFSLGSFTSVSFNLSEYEYEYSSSFSVSSFEAGSFGYGSFKTAEKANDSLSVAAYKENKCPCNVRITQLSPEEKIKLNITLCPLNRFGYGINLV